MSGAERSPSAGRRGCGHLVDAQGLIYVVKAPEASLVQDACTPAVLTDNSCIVRNEHQCTVTTLAEELFAALTLEARVSYRDYLVN